MYKAKRAFVITSLVLVFRPVFSCLESTWNLVIRSQFSIRPLEGLEILFEKLFNAE